MGEESPCPSLGELGDDALLACLLELWVQIVRDLRSHKILITLQGLNVPLK